MTCPRSRLSLLASGAWGKRSHLFCSSCPRFAENENEHEELPSQFYSKTGTHLPSDRDATTIQIKAIINSNFMHSK